MKKRKGLRKYINGTKGAVSLLLALCISPLLSVSLLLVESVRYQNAVELMQETIDISSFATLAEYDSYLDDRFGLLAVSQKAEINNTFSNYLKSNAPILGKGVTVNTSNAKGAFALSDPKVLKQQIMEFSEISVAAETVIEGLDIEELFNELSKNLGTDKLKKLEKTVNVAQKLADVAKEAEKLIESITDTITQYKKYETAKEDYSKAYDSFEESALDVSEAREKLDTLLADSTAVEDDVEAAKKNLSEAEDKLIKNAANYKDKASSLKTELSTTKSNITGIIDAADALPEALQDTDDALKKASEDEDDKKKDKASDSTLQWIIMISDQITNTFKSTIGADYENRVNTELNNLQSQINELSEFKTDDIESGWESDDVNEEYGTVTISTFGEGLLSSLENLMKDLNEKAAVDGKTAVRASSLIEVINQLMGIDILFDGRLNAVVDQSYMHTYSSMSVSSQMFVSSMVTMLQSGEDFIDSITSFNILKAIKSLAEFLVSIAEFLTAVITYVGQIIVNLAVYISSGPAEWYNGILLYGYAAYNLPNRTEYTSSSAVSGYSYEKVFELAEGRAGEATVGGKLRDLATMGNTTGTDQLFKGAEAEYILVGSNSEKLNQSVTFMDLYLLRLALDIFFILTNEEVSVMAAAAGPLAWVVKIGIVLIEPLLDTVILVNGGTEALFKQTYLYICPSGIDNLFEDLVGITAISSGLQSKLTEAIQKEVNGGSGSKEPKEEKDKDKSGDEDEDEDKGLLSANYTEHMLLLILLMIDQETYLDRMQNLIQMEAGANSRKTAEVFELNKAFTYIESDVEYVLNPMFDLKKLTENGLFKVKRHQFLGY